MGRPREFDEDVVLDRALNAFWESGYASTSISDLEKATGLAKGSLYKAFEDKHALFMRALDRYLTVGINRLRGRLDSQSTAEAGLIAWMQGVAEVATEDPAHKGCFGVNCTIELAPSDPKVRARLVRHEREIEALYAGAVRQGIQEGTFRADLAPDEAARFINGVIQGMQVLGKSSLKSGEAERLVQFTLRALK